MLRLPHLEPLGALESLVMELVWESHPASAREVCDRLKGSKRRAYTTVMTTLDRLHKKGLLKRKKEGLAWIYEPVLTRGEFERALADRLAREIVGGHGDLGLAAFVDAAARADEALLDRLERLIADHRRRGRQR